MKLQLVGCSHHTASVKVREQLAFNPDQVRQALGQLRDRYPDTEAVLLSTCNRMELYTASIGENGGPGHEQLVEFLAEFHGIGSSEVFDDLFERNGEDAVRHLFTVASSLDSMVVGEPQILSQVKQAYRIATACDSAGTITHSIFQTAMKVAGRVTTETQIQEKRVSIPSVAVAEFAGSIFERFDDKQVLVIGAGEMAEETLRYLTDAGTRDVTVVNRTRSRAEALATKFDGHAAAWEDVLELLTAADLVVSTTGAEQPVVTRQQFQQIEAARFQRPLFILDLAVPRDFEPSIGDCIGVYLYSIDDLRTACDRNRRDREKELPAALKIIEEETAGFMADLHHRATGPIIQRLRQGWQRPKEDELARLLNKLPDLDDRGRDEIRQSFDRLINKLIHPPLESLRDESRHGTPHALLDALKRLFQLRD